MAKNNVSPARSFKGWKFSEWFKGNWKTIKEILKAGIPLLIGWATTHNPIWTVIITGVGKLILDTGEYYFKQI